MTLKILEFIRNWIMKVRKRKIFNFEAHNVYCLPLQNANDHTLLQGVTLHSRRNANHGYSSANIVQAEHHCLQVYSWGSPILYDEFMCSSRYQY